MSTTAAAAPPPSQGEPENSEPPHPPQQFDDTNASVDAAATAAAAAVVAAGVLTQPLPPTEQGTQNQQDQDPPQPEDQQEQKPNGKRKFEEVSVSTTNAQGDGSTQAGVQSTTNDEKNVNITGDVPMADVAVNPPPDTTNTNSEITATVVTTNNTQFPVPRIVPPPTVLTAAPPSPATVSATRWYPSSILIEARTFEGTPVNADLMNVIGRGVKANKCTLSERYYLPAQYDQNTAEYRAKTIAPIFASACACAGCEVRLKGWEKSKGFLKFVCPQYRRYKSTSKQQPQPQPSPGGSLLGAIPNATTTPSNTVDNGNASATPDMGRVNSSSDQDAAPSENLSTTGTPASTGTTVAQNTRSAAHRNSGSGSIASTSGKKTKASNRNISRPMDKESTCPFSFLVFWEEFPNQDNLATDMRRGRWFICATGAGTPYHEGHSRKEFSEGELRRKQLQVEGAYEILLPYYKKIVDLVDRDEEKLNQSIGRFCHLIENLKRQYQPENRRQEQQTSHFALSGLQPQEEDQKPLPPGTPEEIQQGQQQQQEQTIAPIGVMVQECDQPPSSSETSDQKHPIDSSVQNPTQQVDEGGPPVKEETGTGATEASQSHSIGATENNEVDKTKTQESSSNDPGGAAAPTLLEQAVMMGGQVVDL